MAPVNDNFADAIDLGWPLPASVAGTTLLATEEAGEPTFSTPTMRKTVWYKFTPTATVSITASTVGGASWDTMLSLYAGTVITALTGIAGNDDTGGTQSTLSGTVTAGVVHYLQLGGFSGASGAFTLTLSGTAPPAAPANDNFASAAVLSGLPGQMMAGSTVSATREAGEPTASIAMPTTVWFRYVAGSTGTVRFEVPYAGTLNRLVLWQGTTLAGLTELGAAADSTSVNRIEVVIPTVGVTYYAQVSGSGSATGAFSLVTSFPPLAPPPVSDSIAGAIDLGWPLPPTLPGTTADAGVDASEPNFGQPSIAKTVWYKFTATTGTEVTMMSDTFPVGGTIYDQWDMMAALWQETPTGLIGITNSDLITGFASSYMRAVVVPGATYYLQIGGDSTSTSPWGFSGAFCLIFSALVATLPPANDSFATASDFGWPLSYAYGYTALATTEAGEPLPGAQTKTVWFRFVAAQAATVTFGIRNPHYYAHRITIYRGTSIGGLTQLSGAPSATATAAVVAGETYYVQIGFPGGLLGSSPSYEMSTTTTLTGAAVAVVHNAFAFASDGDLHPVSSYTGLPFFRKFTGFAYMDGSNLEPGEPQPTAAPIGNTVWYSFHSDVACKVDVGCYGNSWATVLGVYTGDSLEDLTEVASAYPASAVTLIIAPDTVYYAQVGKYDPSGLDAPMPHSQYSQFYATPRRITANDDWADAETVSLVVGGTVTRSGPFEGAGVEPNEPDPPVCATGPSLWYKFTAPGSVPVTIEMFPGESDYYGRMWDSVIGVYTGSALDALTPVASNDDYVGMGYGSRLTMAATGGTTYYVQAAIRQSEYGDFEYGYEIPFEIRFTAGAPPPEPPPPPKLWPQAAWLEGFDEVATEDLPRKYYRTFGSQRVVQGGRFGEGGYLVMEDSGAGLEWTMSSYTYSGQYSDYWTMGFAFRAPLSTWGDAVAEVGVCCWGEMDGIIGLPGEIPSIGVRKSWLKVTRAGVLGFGGVGADPACTAAIDLNAWTHVIIANDTDGVLRLYINGTLVSTASETLSGGNALSLGGCDPTPQVAELHFDDWYILRWYNEAPGPYFNILGDVRIKTARVTGEADPYPVVGVPYWYEVTGDPDYLPVRWEPVGASSVAEAVNQRSVGNDSAYALGDFSQHTEWGVPSAAAPIWDDASSEGYESTLRSWILLRVHAEEPAGTEVRSVFPSAYLRMGLYDAQFAVPYYENWTDLVTTNQAIIDEIYAEDAEFGPDPYREPWDYIWNSWSLDEYDTYRLWPMMGLENNTPERDDVPIRKNSSGYSEYDNGWTVPELNATYFGYMPYNTSNAWVKIQQFTVLYAVPVPH